MFRVPHAASSTAQLLSSKSGDTQHPDVEHKASLGGDDFDEGSNFAVLVNFLGAFEIGGKICLQ
ncbi:MAG: hypothetical protein J6T64_05515 [Bacteroidaceae bacterium]|nr:hypothetical protein [Bacteroidaceae bacterium]